MNACVLVFVFVVSTSAVVVSNEFIAYSIIYIYFIYNKGFLVSLALSNQSDLKTLWEYRYSWRELVQCSGSDVMQYLLPPHLSSSFRPWVRLNCQRCIACIFCVWVCACLCICATTKEVDATPNFFKQCVLYVPVCVRCVRCVHCAILVVLCNGPQRCNTTEGLDQGHRHCYRFSSLSLSCCF